VAGKSKVLASHEAPPDSLAAFIFSALPDARETGMYGTNLQLIVLRCCVCRRWFALHVDPDDLNAHCYGGVYVQHALPYLNAAERELVYSRVCAACWAVLCPDPSQYPNLYN